MTRILILLAAAAALWLVVRKPAPPVPTDTLTQRMQAAYNADPASPEAKASQRDTLRGIYQAMAIRARKLAHETVGDLLAAMQDQAHDMLEEEPGKPVALVEIRKKIVAPELAAALGTDPEAKLDPSLRSKAIETYTRLDKALGGVK